MVRRRKNILRRKLRRDYTRGAAQFIAILLLCALGVWCFAGLDGAWRMLDLSIESYLSAQKLPDFWIRNAAFSRTDVKTVAHLPGVAEVQARTDLEMDAPELGGETSLLLHATDGDFRLDVPLVRSGSMLAAGDPGGCLLEEQFAEAHHLQPGDSLLLRKDGLEKRYTIRGLVLSPEHLVTARSAVPDPLHYGFVYVSALSTGELPFNTLQAALADGADESRVQAAIENALPGCLVQTQATHTATANARNFVIMFRNLSYLFPLLAFSVAAMIVVTTLTRMLENQRIQMGTLKALGYSDGRIRRHYMGYALYPALLGSLLGVWTGHITLPYVIWDIIAVNFRFPWQRQAPVSAGAWAIAVFAVALSLFICWRTYRKEARDTTASLLRPKPPRAGSRLLLERLPRLWDRFSFNRKMIIRNLLRNKGRAFMSMVGILCCNMLIICTYALNDSFTVTIQNYYSRTMRYDLRAELDSSLSAPPEAYPLRLDAGRTEPVMELSVSLRGRTAARAAQLTVLSDDQTLVCLGPDFSLLPLPDHGVVISEKLCGLVGAQAGDLVELRLTGDKEPLRLPLTATVETNLGQGIFMSQSAWRACRKGPFTATALLIAQPGSLCRAQLDSLDEVTEVKDPRQQFADSLNIMDSVSVAFNIMTGVALGLAFVICYNMCLMNFTERTRDYATLKVLGYHQREIRRLILREHLVTVVLGTLAGIWPGSLLTGAIMKGCETDVSRYVVVLKPLSVLIPSLITFLFAVMIQLLLIRRVKSIDMVEALKSVE